MNKTGSTDHPIHQLIRERWSPRAFADKPVPADILRSLFEAARWAPSSNNEQPWAFIVATKEDQATHAKLLSALHEFNQVWAKDASVLVIAVSELAFARNGSPNRNAFYDTGAAVANLTPGVYSFTRWRDLILKRRWKLSPSLQVGSLSPLSLSVILATHTRCLKNSVSGNSPRARANLSASSSCPGIGDNQLHF
ncbi:MAG: nitroreductase family protein [Candidatus Acidiferrum sp.]